MGHLAGKKAYLDLQQRLDRMPVGAPSHRALFDILEELFSEEECHIASSMPLKPVTAAAVARAAKTEPERTTSVLETLAHKGLVADLPRDEKPTLYFLNPTVVGFFEYTMMRVRDDIDQSKVAGLMWEYMREDPQLSYLRDLVSGETFIARPLVNEETLNPELYSEVLDWEKASHIIGEAKILAEGICHCRHVKLHKGQRCDYPLEHCLSLGQGAEYLIRNGLAQEIDHARAMDILGHARSNGCVQMADNVRSKPLFICNCCKCCCEMMEAFRTLPSSTHTVSSNYVATHDDDACTGCGKCAKACPIDAIDMVPAGPTDTIPKRKKRAQIAADLCLGCGVCHTACSFDGIRMEAAPQRRMAPEGMMERLMLQAIERGKLGNFLFADPGRLSHRSLGSFCNVLLKLPPAKQMLADRQMRSRFVSSLLARQRRKPAPTPKTNQP